MGLTVVAAPVPAEKIEQHRAMLAQLNGARRSQMEAIHTRAGVRERGFIQQMPDGSYLYITIFEGDNPNTLLQRLVEADLAEPEFAQWLFPQLEEIYGMSSQSMPPAPQQVFDSGPV